MNTLQTPSPELAQEHFARRVTALLTESTGELPHDISERLRVARMQALAKRKKVALVHQTSPAIVQVGNTAALGGWRGEGGNWWRSLMAAIPAMALVAGLVVINVAQDEYGTAEVAEVDAALLTDDLPPSAYADPGFVQFLKMGGTSNH
ncbi:MAG: DUF3619 family protein [Burkholderiaceae bacterium]|nr:DUF3619 family protein [Burkholderiaceae bacterium]